MKEEDVWLHINLDASELIQVYSYLNHLGTIVSTSMHTSTKWEKEGYVRKIIYDKYVNHTQVSIIIHKGKDIWLDVEFEYRGNKKLCPLTIGYYKENTCISTHYKFNHLGQITSTFAWDDIPIEQLIAPFENR